MINDRSAMIQWQLRNAKIDSLMDISQVISRGNIFQPIN